MINQQAAKSMIQSTSKRRDEIEFLQWIIRIIQPILNKHIIRHTMQELLIPKLNILVQYLLTNFTHSNTLNQYDSEKLIE
jgi:hypothetical protein